MLERQSHPPPLSQFNINRFAHLRRPGRGLDRLSPDSIVLCLALPQIQVYVKGALLKRVKEYILSLQLPPEDQHSWGDSAARSKLFAFVVHGLPDDAGMSRPLRKCLMDLRHALQPTPGFTGPLPRCIVASLSQLLPLHLFLTRHQRPQLSHKPTPAPGPDEEEQPNNARHAAAAAGISEKLAFDPSWQEGGGMEEEEEKGEEEKGEKGKEEEGPAAHQPTPKSLRPYVPIARLALAPVCSSGWEHTGGHVLTRTHSGCTGSGVFLKCCFLSFIALHALTALLSKQ